MLKRSFRGTHGFAITFLLLALGCASQERPARFGAERRERASSRPSSRRSGRSRRGTSSWRAAVRRGGALLPLALESDPRPRSDGRAGPRGVQRGATRRPCRSSSARPRFRARWARVPGAG